MGLCDLCQTIPLWNLPPFQQSDYLIRLAGKSNNLTLHRKDNVTDVPKPLGFHWHQDRGGLWQSAAGGCGLCRLVDKQARLPLSGLNASGPQRDTRNSKSPHTAIHKDVKATAKERIESEGADNNVDDLSTFMVADDNNPLLRPSFDLWLTNRGSLGPGLMVFSTSLLGSGVINDRCLIPLAIIGFCNEPQGPPSNILTVSTTEALLGQPPAHLIDLGEGTNHRADKTVTVYEPTDGERLIYAALKFGEVEISSQASSRTVATGPANNGNSDTRTKGGQINENNLSQALQDAIITVRRLGFRYVWISSLCVPPGEDGETWNRNSDNLAMVYRNAHLVISATGASDPSGGLSKQHRPNEHEHLLENMHLPKGSHIIGNITGVLQPLLEEIVGRYT